MTHLGEFDKTNDTEGASMIRSNCIACLSHLAALYHSVGEIQPSARATLDSLCDAVLNNLGSLTQGMKLEEVTYFDLLLKVSDPCTLENKLPDVCILQSSWKKAIAIYDSRICSLSLEEGGQLWRWREIVVEAYADFERRVPKCEPPILIVLAWSEDGRSEESKYPNFMVPAARESYGI